MRRTFILFVVAMASCENRNGVEFVLHNNSNETIDSVRISTSDKRATIKIKQLKPGSIANQFLDMNTIKKVDGDYSIEIHAFGTTKRESVGYYTNGFSLDDRIDLFIERGALKYNFKPKN